MRPNAAELVDPIFDLTWGFQKSLQHAPSDAIAEAQATLKQRLSPLATSEFGRASGDFLGIHYPIVCWIDELMTANPTVAPRWNERKMEGELFGTNDRAWKFWRQAELAESLGHEEWLELFYLCVSHGFTGNLIDSPEKLQNWMHRIRIRIGAVPELKLPFSHDLPPAPNVPPLRGRRAMVRMTSIAAATSVVLFPMLSYVATRLMCK